VSGLRFLKAIRVGQSVLHAIWILSDIEAKAIAMGCSMTLQLSGGG
jgi:hypothetical protein